MGHYAHMYWADMLAFKSLQDLAPVDVFLKNVIGQKENLKLPHTKYFLSVWNYKFVISTKLCSYFNQYVKCCHFAQCKDSTLKNGIRNAQIVRMGYWVIMNIFREL